MSEKSTNMNERIPENRRRLYRAAMESWGDEAQMNKAAEEFSEAAAALNRTLNGQEPPAELLGELADARLMLEQMEYSLYESSEVDEAVSNARADLFTRLRKHGDVLGAQNDE